MTGWAKGVQGEADIVISVGERLVLGAVDIRFWV